MPEEKLTWEERYREEDPETMPWYFADLDPDVDQWLDSQGIRGGRVLDLGAGPGTQAIALALRGFQVTATDVSGTAVRKAATVAVASGAAVDFREDDILATGLRERFDLILDRGCFHVFDEAQRPRYIAAVTGLMEPGGLLLLKCFSDKQPGTDGPHRLSPVDIRTLFGESFEILTIDETVYYGSREPRPLALFCVLRLTP